MSAVYINCITDCERLFLISCMWFVSGVLSVRKHSIGEPCMIFMFCHMFLKRSSHLFAANVLADSIVRLCWDNMSEFIFHERNASFTLVISVPRSKYFVNSVFVFKIYYFIIKNVGKDITVWEKYSLGYLVLRYVLFCTIICIIFTSLCKNFLKLTCVLAEAFRCHGHHSQYLKHCKVKWK